MSKRNTASPDAALARWKTRLKRAITMINKLEKQKKRIEKKQRAPVAAINYAVSLPTVGAIVANANEEADARRAAEVEREILSDTFKEHEDTRIPEFLRRGLAAQNAADAVIADKIKSEQAEAKKAKARGRAEKHKAKMRGDLKRMPRSGKAALDYIKGAK
jgi:hypothetical protein